MGSSIPTAKFDTLIDLLDKKKIKYEIMGRDEREISEDTTYREKMIGLSTNKHTYHWFRWTSIMGKEFIDFDHTYSQNTGRSKRGLSHRIKVTRSLEKKLGSDVTAV